MSASGPGRSGSRSATSTAFTAELAASLTALAARYHDESTDGGRWHRLIVGAHPPPAEPAATTVDIDPAPAVPDHDTDPEKG